MRTAAKTVVRLIAAWEARDADAIAACFTADGIWHNMPMTPVVGRDAIRAATARFLATMTSVSFVIHHQAQAGPNVVLNERSDIFETAAGHRMVFPVMGVFEVEDGLIRAWRDYFDPAVMNGPTT